MTTVKIQGIDIKFPFLPYDIQKDYMSKVIECIESKQNGILESPTGTGKTLSLLCASLAWLDNQKKQVAAQYLKWEEPDDYCDAEAAPLITVPRIIYSSRTHTQLQQAMNEMKKTEYNHMRACVLGSREQMCIDEEVCQEKNTSLKVNMCRMKVKSNQCKNYNRVEKEKNSLTEKLKIVDMEDIMTLGRCNHFCPYYMARELKMEADVIFMPYNYLLDPWMNKSMGFEFEGSIVIFDEAHNIEKVCEDSVSVQIKSTDVDAAIDDVSAILDLFKSDQGLDVEEITPQKLLNLKSIFGVFNEQLKEIRLVYSESEGTVFDGDYIFLILEKAGIVGSNFMEITNLLDSILDFLAGTKLIQRSGYSLQIFGNLLFIVFFKTDPIFRQKMKECFKVRIDEERVEQKRRYSNQAHNFNQKCRVLNLWCFSPGFGMNMLLDRQLHCVILTSGTLAPLKPLISELEIKIGVQIENPHIIPEDQVCVKILSRGPDMELLNSNFKNRENPKYLQSLGLVISNLVRIIPDGVLIFFPSYVSMEKSVEFWRNTGIWDAINRTKPIYVEPKDKASFNTAMADYYAKIQDPSYKGAIFMGVCRGKVSEGLDFADINGRAVFITGLPYPPLKDPKIILKKRYLDFRHSKDRQQLRGDDWYSLEATRAINQAIGRVIRHQNDYGAIILLDSRFTNPKIKGEMSLWLRRHIVDMKNFGEIIRNVRGFFQKVQEKLPKEEDRIMIIEELVEVEAPSGSSD